MAYPDRVGDGYVHLTIVKRGDQRPAPPKVDTAWMADAGCKGSTDIMFPTDRPGGHQRATLARYIAEAQRVCADCPVADECRQFAVNSGERAGIWGGGSADTYRRERWAADPTRQRSFQTAKPIDHGTERGYRMHLRRGEAACQECIDGRNAERRAARADGRAA